MTGAARDDHGMQDSTARRGGAEWKGKRIKPDNAIIVSPLIFHTRRVCVCVGAWVCSSVYKAYKIPFYTLRMWQRVNMTLTVL